jgi:hypothetical protein
MILVLTLFKKNTANSIIWPELFTFLRTYSLENLPQNFTKELFLDFKNYIDSFSNFPVSHLVTKYYYVNNAIGDTITCRIFDNSETYLIFETINEENKNLRLELFEKMNLNVSMKIIDDKTLIESILEANDVSYDLLFDLL